VGGGVRLAGLVLCGGASRRMGRDKALLELDGRPLVLRVAERLSRVAHPVLLAPGTAGRLGDLGYPEVADALPGRGPLGGLVAGLEASPHELTAVAGVDLPFASPEVLAFLASLHRGEDAVVPVTASGPQPLHAVFARSALPALRGALEEGRLALRDALAGLRIREVGEGEWRVVDPDGTFALNLNTSEDLERVRRALEGDRTAGGGGAPAGP
jgi:molybdopterin-guanine dinucleotide biosynthesis protein A